MFLFGGDGDRGTSGKRRWSATGREDLASAFVGAKGVAGR